VRVNFNGWFYWGYEGCPAEAAIPCAHRLDLRRKYELARVTDPIALPFRRGTIPIVLFLRLMDLIWYEERGEPFLPCYPGSQLFKQFVTPPSRAVPLLRAVIDALRPNSCEVWVYSDGLPERSWLIHRIASAGNRRADAAAMADRALDFHRVEMARFADCGAPVRFKMKGPNELIREMVHAFSRAPFALNSRACHLGRWTVRTGFPDLGQRDPTLFPIITPDRTPESVAAAVNEFLSNVGTPAPWV
jgi:hypothetical protein